jgi:hypothetical protein
MGWRWGRVACGVGERGRGGGGSSAWVWASTVWRAEVYGEYGVEGWGGVGLGGVSCSACALLE